jgi:hypothetical protein
MVETRDKYSSATRSYIPSTSVENLLKAMLQLEVETKKLNKKRNAGGATRVTKKEFDREKRILDKQRRNLNRMKVEVLNKHIFPGMANLTVLLEHMLESPYIHGIFQEDLKALFFAEYTVNDEVKPPVRKPPVFARFANASCKLVMDKQDEHGKMTKIFFPDFRLILCDIMQESVYRAILNIAPFKYGDLDFLQKTLYADMDRLHAWTTMLAREARRSLKFDKDRRPALF